MEGKLIKHVKKLFRGYMKHITSEIVDYIVPSFASYRN
jgi:hypothetical protein